MNIFLSAFVPENLVLRDGFGSQSSPASSVYSSPYSGWIWFLPISAAASIYSFITAIRHWVSPEFSGSHAIAYRWRSLPRVRRHGASKPQGSSERVLPCLAGHHGPINIHLSFPHPLLVWSGHIESTVVLHTNMNHHVGTPNVHLDTMIVLHYFCFLRNIGTHLNLLIHLQVKNCQKI